MLMLESEAGACVLCCPRMREVGRLIAIRGRLSESGSENFGIKISSCHAVQWALNSTAPIQTLHAIRLSWFNNAESTANTLPDERAQDYVTFLGQ
jgi:hypothetical protein